MNFRQSLPLLLAVTVIAQLALPTRAQAGATYICNGGTCSGDGGNGDNGTNNGNNSSNNTINVNLPASALAQTPASASSARRSVSIPVQLPSFSASGCGSRSTMYGGLTGSPGGYGSNLGFGVGFLTAFGKEPDSCRPAAGYGMVSTPAAPLVVQAAAPIVVTVPAAPVADGACVPIDFDLAEFYAHDLSIAKHTLNTVRIERDMSALDRGCFHALVVRAIAGR